MIVLRQAGRMFAGIPYSPRAVASGDVITVDGYLGIATVGSIEDN